jgi:hypothetical protein
MTPKFHYAKPVTNDAEILIDLDVHGAGNYRGSNVGRSG